MKKIVIGCDNAAMELKSAIKQLLLSMGYEVSDVGVASADDDTYYPLVAKKACEELLREPARTEGILICGTGIGMCISANKFEGIRAAVCHDVYSAQRAKLSNNSNVLCMGARVIGPELAKELVKVWLSLEFIDGSSTPKVLAIAAIEHDNFRLR